MNRILNFKLVSRILSLNLLILFGGLFICDVIAALYNEATNPFTIASSIALFLSGLFLFLSKGESKNYEIKKREAYLSVTLSWVLIGLIGSLPYIFSGSIPTFVNALFESISGFTTTGASILTDIEKLPKSILLWRSLTNWIGGIGIIVLVILILPSLKIGGYQLFTSESSMQDKLTPKIRYVGYRILLVYIALTAVEIVLLTLGKMSLFDSICHSFSTIATGGFSTSNTSLANYSPYIQYVVMIFMLLSGMNFAIHYNFMKGNFKAIYKNEEFFTYLFIVFLLGMVITISLMIKLHEPFELAFRESFFQIISIITCTGFASADYLNWPVVAWTIIFFAMFLGGSTGSTAGGIKIARHIIMFKNLKKTFKKLVSPNVVIPIRLNRNIVSSQVNSTTVIFIATYILIFIVGSFLLIVDGEDMQTATSSVATSLAGVGPGIGTVGPTSNFNHLHIFSKLVLILLMVIGRLEIYTIVVLFTKKFWCK